MGDFKGTENINYIGYKHGELPTSTASKIRAILSDGEDTSDPDRLLNIHPLFTQLDVLVHFTDGRQGWKEMARWLKYTETVEVGQRWSKPHVATTSMHGLLQLRKAICEGQFAARLGVSVGEKEGEVVDVLLEAIRTCFHLSDDQCEKIRQTILEPHKHKHRKADKKTKDSHPLSDNAEKKKKPLRRRSGDGTDIAAVYHSYPPGTNSDNLVPYKPNKKLTKKLPKNTEAANVLVGQVDFLTETVVAFVRVNTPSTLADLTEVAYPTRFVFLVLGPQNSTSIWELSELGRSMAALLNDKIFCEVAYKAKTLHDLVVGVDEFIDDLTVLPPSIWDPSIRLEPPQHTISMDRIRLRLDDSKRGPNGPVSEVQEEGAGDDESLKRTGRIFGGFIKDVKNRYPMYLSDFKDGLAVQCVASIVFLYFACITPIVTFGGLMGQKTEGYMGTMEMLLAGAICGFFYALFAGQPLTIVGATGPLLVFESIICHLCTSSNIDFLSLRFYIGIWVMILLLLVVAFDLSALVRYITRFTEEAFAVLISVIFIYEAFDKIYHISEHQAVHTGVVRELRNFRCYCVNATNDSLVPDDNATYGWISKLQEDCLTYKDRVEVRRGCVSEEECLGHHNWTLTGPACHIDRVTHSIPDVFFLSVILFLGTFTLAMFFRNLKTSSYFSSIVRTTLGDFAVFLSVAIWTGIDLAFGIPTPKLDVPDEIKPTRSDRNWLVNPGNITYWWLIPLAILPALLAVILIFLDQQITAVIVNRKEHKLKKPHGYHLDLFVLALLIGICSALGLPWFVAATVRCITHVKSLMTESEVKIPGEKAQITGVREQRVTGLCIHLLIGLSTLITAVLQCIPMPVLYGVFLYMGVTSLGDVQFFERVTILLMPAKYQPDLIFLRHVRTFRVHIFTLIQMICFVAMWIVKEIEITSIAFPLLLLALMVVRKALDYVFTQSELYWLDHLLPDDQRREKEDKNRSLEKSLNGPKYVETTFGEKKRKSGAGV